MSLYVFPVHFHSFLQTNNFAVEAEYVLKIARWHEASDGRGLSEDERRVRNMEMMTYLVEDWMPWYHQTPGGH